MDDDLETFSENDQISNIDTSGKIVRHVESGATPCYVTKLEMVALIIHRSRQINTPDGPFNKIHPSIVKQLGQDASLKAMLIAELLDPEIEYPVLIMRGNEPLRPNKDLMILDKFADIFVLINEDGTVSYNNVREDIYKKPNAEYISLMNEIEKAEQEDRRLRKGFV